MKTRNIPLVLACLLAGLALGYLTRSDTAVGTSYAPEYPVASYDDGHRYQLFSYPEGNRVYYYSFDRSTGEVTTAQFVPNQSGQATYYEIPDPAPQPHFQITTDVRGTAYVLNQYTGETWSISWQGAKRVLDGQ